ncbi:probable ATP-dependent RNA helicase DDX20 [Oppia nitens]|uniref:probable ATP-dependent RNA helicase DDX20 n=1 Tax=Oppia nitens TaxID=1686743 RepID=UPI0023DC905D|nr:probable ATP-dependent RNA helicase DDX20 [Oppia nitens]
MAQQLAHNLNDKKWRSEDINVCDEESDITFKSLNLKESVLSGLTANGFLRLSAIQLHAIPLSRCGLDLIVQSKSGTGKTVVFVVTALEMIESFESNVTQVLIICPTREIAVQTNHVMNQLAKHTDIRCCPVIGGTKLKEDVNMLGKCQAVVGTPGRIKQLISLNVLKTNSIRLLVLDECDKLMDNNFKQQIDDIFECLPQNKQMIAVSATMGSELANFLTKYMRTPVFVRLNADNPALIGLKQYYWMTEYHHLNHINFDNKIQPLIEILSNVSFSQCLVFSNYQTRARMLCDKLNALNWKTEYISADKCQTERLKAISKLRKFKCRVLVSTDLTARGIDVYNINLVINMDTPFDSQTYLHRIGRAGRFGTSGIAITIASKGREVELLQNIIKDSKLKVEELKHPIPEDIWKMDDNLNNDFMLNDNKKYSEKSVQELNSNTNNNFDDIDETKSDSNDISNQFMSFNDIISEYNLIKSSSNSENNLKSQQQNSNDNPIQTNYESNSYYDDIDEDNVEDISFERKDPSVNLIQNGLNQWANALFPPIHSVSTPSSYNQWIDNNKHLWTYMLDPFQALQLT